MLSKTGQPTAVSASFDDFERFEEALVGWDPNLRKLDRRPFMGRVLRAEVGAVALVATRAESLLELSGAVAPGLRSFGLPMPDSSPATWCGRPVSWDTVSIYEPSGGFEAHTQPGFETIVYSIAPDVLAEIGEQAGYDAAGLVGTHARVEPCEPRKMLRLRERLRAALGSIWQEPVPEARAAAGTGLVRDLPLELLEALDHRQAPPDVARPERSRALRRALEYVNAHPDDHLTVLDLCATARTSERTLRRAFQEELGTAPKAYLQARRLNGVYRELSSGRAPTVGDAAARWGFWHLGQLCADYKRHFHELPSATLARGHSARARA